MSPGGFDEKNVTTQKIKYINCILLFYVQELKREKKNPYHCKRTSQVSNTS